MNKHLTLGVWFATAALITTGAVFTYNSFIADKDETYRVQLPPSVIKPASAVEAPPYSTEKVPTVKTSMSNTIYFDDEVNEITVNTALALLRKAERSNKTVYLVISSPGGSVFDGVRLTSYIEAQGNINTVCASLCASMAAHIHQAGAKRLMLPSGVLMFHPATAGVQGQIEQMLNRINMFKSQVDQLDAKIARRSGIPFDEFKRRLSFEYWLLPNQAAEVNISDGTVSIETGDDDHPNGISVRETAIKKMQEAQAEAYSKKVRPSLTVELTN